MSSNSPRRSGGRSARQALRAAPLTEDVRPIRAGMDGGAYKPLSDIDIQKIHNAALDALETIGLADAPPSGVEILTNAGAIQGDDGRKASREVTLFSRDGKNDLLLSGNRVHYGTAGAAVHIVDVHGNEYRECTVQDLHDAACIVDKLENVHFLQRPMVCRDIPDNYEMDLNSIYACTSGTTKHVGVSFTEPAFVPGAFEMLYEIAGGEAQYRERPFVSNSNCFVVPPMKFATESCEVMDDHCWSNYASNC